MIKIQIITNHSHGRKDNDLPYVTKRAHICLVWYGTTWIPGRKLLCFVSCCLYHHTCLILFHYLIFHYCLCLSQHLVNGHPPPPTTHFARQKYMLILPHRVSHVLFYTSDLIRWFGRGKHKPNILINIQGQHKLISNQSYQPGKKNSLITL